MTLLEETLSSWQDSLCETVDVSALRASNPIAHKWKATFRSLSIREAIAWRTLDLLEQSKLLSDSGHLLGARILLRAAFESVGVLIYLNQLMRSVVNRTQDFHGFSEITAQLMLGSRDKTTPYDAKSIVTILKKCDKRYPGLFQIYEDLCESAHPNYEGTSAGYSTIDTKNFITSFSNKWEERFGAKHEDGIFLCIQTFTHEYNDEWFEAFKELESWIEINDKDLEATRPDA